MHTSIAIHSATEFLAFTIGQEEYGLDMFAAQFRDGRAMFKLFFSHRKQVMRTLRMLGRVTSFMRCRYFNALDLSPSKMRRPSRRAVGHGANRSLLLI